MFKKLLITVIFLSFLGGTLVAVLAQTSPTPSPSPSPTVSPSPTPSPARGQQRTAGDIICLQNAIEKRETAIVSAFGIKSSTIINALIQRKNALKEAWGKNTKQERTRAQKDAWNAWRTALKNVRSAYKTTVRSAWSTFKSDAKSCGSGNYYNGEKNQMGTDLGL